MGKTTTLIVLVWILLGAVFSLVISFIIDLDYGFWFYLGYLTSIVFMGTLASKFG